MNPWFLDILVLFAYFVVIIGVGLWASRGKASMEGYALGNRSMPWGAILASILAAEISAGTFLGTPGEGFLLKNFTYVQLAIGTVLARIIVASIFIKPFYDMKVVSIYEFLEVRFGRLTKRAASAVFLLTRAIASGSRLFVAAVLLTVAFELYTGNFDQSLGEKLLIFAIALFIITLGTAIYTVVGGIKAVVWTDLIQVTIMFSAMGYVLVLLWNSVGGWGEAQRIISETPNPTGAELKIWDTGIRDDLSFYGNFKNILETEYTLWAAFIASIFVTMATHGTDQDMVQRMLTAKNHKKGKLALILSGIADIPIVFVFVLIGVLIWAFYEKTGKTMTRQGTEIFSWFILTELPSGMRGLMAAGLFATAMGSLSTALNALATSYTRDWYIGLFRPKATEEQQVRMARISTAAFAVILCAIGVGTAWISLKYPSLGIIAIVLGSFGYTYGSLLGIFLVGMLTKTRGSEKGNIAGMISGAVVVAVLSDLPNGLSRAMGFTLYELPSWMPHVAFTWWIFFGTLVTFSVAICFKTKKKEPPIAEPLTE